MCYGPARTYLVGVAERGRHSTTRTWLRSNDTHDASELGTLRRDYNVWESTSTGAGPFTFRVTDVYDRVITDSNVPLSPNQMVQSSGQFAQCQ